MRPTQPWHHSRFGTFALWMGSIQVAIPILILVSIAMVAGTYIESTQSGKVARSLVYGSWWFVELMGAVCLSLIFAVVTRYPWQRRHVGFIVVHASLVALIASGFWSMFGRVEGRLALEQGKEGATIESEQDVLELVEHEAGKFRLLGVVAAPSSPGRITLAGHSFTVTEVWPHTREDFEVLDGGPQPYRAVEVSLDPTPTTGFWVGDEAVGGAARMDDLVIRLLSADSKWEPPAPAAKVEGTIPAFVVAGVSLPLRPGSEGGEVFPGWTLKSRREYSRAKVVAEGIVEAADGAENPAIDVVITDGKGTTERHTVFRNFPDMVLAKTIEGEAKSGARLVWSAEADAAGEEALVLFGPIGALQGAHLSKQGEATMLPPSGGLPWTFDAGGRKITVLREFSHAREDSRLTRAEPTGDRRPALVISAGDPAAAKPLAWKSMLPAGLAGRNAMLRYGPMSAPLPFTVRLDQFRKTDYPGTEMAMAYESGVTVFSPGVADFTTTISMNNPLVHSGWKVYQSGFIGDTVSIFSVMKDPGLPLTYLASTTLCIGICITFYGRGYGKGHPGIPSPFARKESSHVASHAGSDPDPVPVVGRLGGPALAALDGSDERDPHPGRRARHAVGNLRE